MYDLAGSGHDGPFRSLMPSDGSDAIYLEDFVISLRNIVHLPFLPNSTSMQYESCGFGAGGGNQLILRLPRNRQSFIKHNRTFTNCTGPLDTSPPYNYAGMDFETAEWHHDPCFMPTVREATDHLDSFALRTIWYSVDYRMHLEFFHGFYRLVHAELPTEPEVYLKKRNIALAISIHVRVFPVHKFAASAHRFAEDSNFIAKIIPLVKQECFEHRSRAGPSATCWIFIGSNNITHEHIQTIMMRLEAEVENVEFLTSEDTMEYTKQEARYRRPRHRSTP
eukprot:GEMP01019661.1.p1 GENE.GEMP01019661.1~~GEMP01019661.1.p1  ORF type:complete len:279 (+),score=30.75 GEMP01019661.1:311-1147(+)